MFARGTLPTFHLKREAALLCRKLVGFTLQPGATKRWHHDRLVGADSEHACAGSLHISTGGPQLELGCPATDDGWLDFNFELHSIVSAKDFGPSSACEWEQSFPKKSHSAGLNLV